MMRLGLERREKSPATYINLSRIPPATKQLLARNISNGAYFGRVGLLVVIPRFRKTAQIRPATAISANVETRWLGLDKTTTCP